MKAVDAVKPSPPYILSSMQAGVVDHDVPCVGCGYNLRTLPRTGNCPECGQNVSISLVPPPLARVDRRIIQRIAVGIHLAIFSPVLQALAIAFANRSVFVALAVLFPGSVKGWLVIAASHWRGELDGPAMLFWIGALGEATGLWLATTAPDPLDFPEAPSRIYIRICSILSLLLGLAMHAGGACCAVIMVPLEILQVIVFIVYCSRLAERVRFFTQAAWLDRCNRAVLILLVALASTTCVLFGTKNDAILFMLPFLLLALSTIAALATSAVMYSLARRLMRPLNELLKV